LEVYLIKTKNWLKRKLFMTGLFA